MSTSRARVYALHGLSLLSELPLAGFALDDGSPHDYAFRRGPAAPVGPDPPPGRVLLVHDGPDGRPLYVAAEQRGTITLRVPGRCEFALDRATRTVTCQTEPGSDERLTGVLLAGLVVSFLLGLEGHTVLHASAVEVDGSVIAFAGPSGAGKSTLASLMCADGASLVTDDVLRVRVQPDDRLVCVGGAPELRLREGASWALERFATAPAVVRTVDGRLAIAPPPMRAARLPLAVVVLPRLTASADAVALAPVTGVHALVALAAATRIVGWREPDIARVQFHEIARVAERVRVVEATLPSAPALRAQIAPSLRALCATQCAA